MDSDTDSIPRSNKGVIHIKCPTDFNRCAPCFYFDGRTCKYLAFKDGLVCIPNADMGTPGIDFVRVKA